MGDIVLMQEVNSIDDFLHDECDLLFWESSRVPVQEVEQCTI